MKTDKIALITETGNGLSHKFAEILSAEHYSVVIAAKGSAYNELTKFNLDGIKVLDIDLTQTAGVVQLYSYLKTAYGKLDILINNAEVANGFGQKITELDINEVKALYNENLFSVMNTIKHLVSLLSKSDNPRIINITSGLGDINKMKADDFCYKDYKMIAYATAKSALDMLTVILDKELAPNNIKVERFDPVRIENCTHNSVDLCKGVKREFIELLQPNTLVY
ncbi:MAG: SDR family NAD(P)-dependent oxidoreductase [Bacteroidota bacterium]